MADLPRFDLGQAGLVLTSSPLHGDQGQLTKAQNIEFKRVQGLGGMGSRAPLVVFSQNLLATMTGDVLSACAIPLPSPVDNLTLPLVRLFTTTGYLQTRDGVTYVSVTLPTAPNGVSGTWNNGMAYTGPYDGTNSTVRVKNKDVQIPGYVSGIVAHPNGKFYVSVVTTPGAFTGIQNAHGWNGGQYNATTHARTSAVAGKVLELDSDGTILRTMGELFGMDETGNDIGTSAAPPHTTFGGQDGRINHDNNGRGPIGGAPGGIAVSASGRLYVTFGVYYLNAATGAGLDTYLGIDYVSMDPDTDTTWTARVTGSQLGVSKTRFDNSASIITSGPGPILPDVFTADTPWFAGFSPDPFTVSSSLGVTTGDHDGSCVFSGGLSGNLKLFPDPNGATIAGIAYWTGLITFGSKVFVAYYDQSNPTSDPSHVRIYVASSDDASTLSLDHDVLTSVTPAPPTTHCIPCAPFLFDPGGGTCLFWPFAGINGHETEGFVLKRTSGGVWSVQTTGLSHLVGPAISFTVEV